MTHLLGIHDIHDHAAFEHACQAGLDGEVGGLIGLLTAGWDGLVDWEVCWHCVYEFVLGTVERQKGCFALWTNSMASDVLKEGNILWSM
jgi:hypothetical protein